MTTSKAEERARAAGDAGAGVETVFGYAAAAIDARLELLGAVAPAWPAPEYQRDPGRFAREVLGVALMPEQLEILEAIRDSRRVAVRGGRKVGKDFVLAVAALWIYCSWPGARVRFTAVKQEQVDDIFWLEVRQRLAVHGRCLECKRTDPTGPRPCPHSRLIPEEPGLLARTGLKSGDFRELVGYTAREAEGAAGISGGNQFYIVDEASAVDDALIEATEGNLMGCSFGRLCLISNPTRTRGQFFRAFHEEASTWRTFHRSSVEIAKKYGGRIPGIATREEIDALVEKYGSGSVFVRVHIHGEFPTVEAGRIFDLHSIEQSQARWGTALAEGPLYIGVDVAGESGTGDESAFSVRRGKKQLELYAKLGLKPEEHLVEVLGVAARHRERNVAVVVVIDRGGEPGAKVWGTFVAYRQAHWQDPPFELVGVDSSRKAQREPKAYDRVRDELAANLADWMREGGAIVEDVQLAKELFVFRWIEQRLATTNKLVDKRTMREELGRSPDRADATALSCWVERHWRPPTAEHAAEPVLEDDPIDPFEAADAAMRMARDFAGGR